MDILFISLQHIIIRLKKKVLVLIDHSFINQTYIIQQ